MVLYSSTTPFARSNHFAWARAAGTMADLAAAPAARQRLAGVVRPRSPDQQRRNVAPRRFSVSVGFLDRFAGEVTRLEADVTDLEADRDENLRRALEAERQRGISEGALRLQTERLTQVRGERDAAVRETSAVAGKLVGALPQLSRYARTTSVELAPNDPVCSRITSDFTSNVQQHKRGPPGASRVEERLRAAPRLEVIRVERLSCPRVQDLYIPQLDHVAGAAGVGTGGRPSVAQLPECVLRAQTLADLNLNEALLYHGAPSDIIESVCTGGFMPQLGGTRTGGLFGVGTYFAAHSSKSDIYTRPDADGERCILLTRVCLGEPHYTNVPMREATLPPPRGPGRPRCDSVVARTVTDGGCVAHPEFVVYQAYQALPQYRIRYRHAAGCLCSNCVDPDSMQITFHLGFTPGAAARVVSLRDGATFGALKQAIHDQLPFLPSFRRLVLQADRLIFERTTDPQFQHRQARHFVFDDADDLRQGERTFMIGHGTHLRLRPRWPRGFAFEKMNLSDDSSV